MQLNPARGRKLDKADTLGLESNYRGLCSSTPRGDGNIEHIARLGNKDDRRFMQLNPARGRKRIERLRVRVAE